MDELSQIDIAFCIDLTNSMAPFLHAARKHVLTILRGLRESESADLCVGIVGYRDHDPSPNDKPTEVYPFTKDEAQTQRDLASLNVGSKPSNTDAAEAVFAGLDACGRELRWRKKAFRIIVLVGDGPPHACGANGTPYPDRFPTADPSGYSMKTMGETLEKAGVFLYALGMVPSSLPSHDHVLEAAFSSLARATGGAYRAAATVEDAIAIVDAIAQRVFGEMSLDRAIFEKLRADGKLNEELESAARAGMVLPPSAYAARSMVVPEGAPPPPAFAPGPMAPPPLAARAAPIAQSQPIAMSAEEVQASVARLKKRGIL